MNEVKRDDFFSRHQVPCVANGDVKSLKDVVEARRKTGCHGVMVATGLLKNPALFAGFQHTPAECVR